MNPQPSPLPDEYPDRPYVIQVKHATFGEFCIETSTPEHNGSRTFSKVTKHLRISETRNYEN